MHHPHWISGSETVRNRSIFPGLQNRAQEAVKIVKSVLRKTASSLRWRELGVFSFWHFIDNKLLRRCAKGDFVCVQVA
jgi:hypothetical protein